MGYDARIVTLNITVSGLSSSMIRNAVSNGEDIRAYVPERVASFIDKNGFYR